MPIKYITIHCAATPEGRDIKPKTVDQWGHDRYGQSSYHYIIGLDGTWIAPLKHIKKGAHVGGHNTDNLGICYVGGMDAKMIDAKDTRTTAQKRAMRTIIRTLREKYGEDVIVRGHRDWPNVHKDCPSFDVQEWLEAGMPI